MDALSCIKTNLLTRKQMLKTHRLLIYMLFMRSMEDKKAIPPSPLPNDRERAVFVERIRTHNDLVKDATLFVKVQGAAAVYKSLRGGKIRDPDISHVFPNLYDELWTAYFMEPYLFQSKQIRTLEIVHDCFLTALALNTPLQKSQVVVEDEDDRVSTSSSRIRSFRVPVDE